jgi:hydrophobic/amphiphilic exporter-1 (mainly G- bacteria), HAE1 family
MTVHLFSVFSLRNRALIALVTIVAALFGGVALTNLKQELIPTISLPSIFIVSTYPGASPEVVNNDVSTPIEAAIQGLPGLDSTTAVSNANSSTITASFSYGTDITTAEQKVQLAINRIQGQIPDSVDTQVLTFSFSDLPVIQIAVTSDLDPHELANRLEATTIPDLKDLDGVSDAALLGATTQRVTITPNKSKLEDHGLSNQSILNALNANGTLLPSGEVTEDSTTLTVQAGVKVESVDAIKDLPLLGATKTKTIPSAFPGQPATKTQVPDSKVRTISDFAKVELVDDPVTGISRVNGEPAVTISVTKTPAGNTVSVSQEVNAKLAELEAAVGNNTKFTIVFDQAPFIEQSIDSLAKEGALGLVFAVIVIFLFLFSFRSTIVAAISIPISVLITFIGMLAADYTLNIITLGALTIAIGRVVDDSIVVIENIKRHLGFEKDKITAIKNAVREVATAVTASTVTTVAVFLPLALVGDVTGELFRPFALTVTIALGASLFVALTIVPVLAYWFLKAPKNVQQGSTDDTSSERPSRLQRGYIPIIRATLARPLVTILVAILVLAGTVALVPSMKTNFLGDSGQNTLTVTQALPLGTSLEAKDAAAQKVETVLENIPGVDVVQLSLGSGGSSLRRSFSGSGDATFSLTTDSSLDQTALQADVRAAVNGIPDAGEITLAASGGGFASSDIEINITAGSDADLTEAADRILGAVKDLPVTAQATSNLAVTQPFIQIQVDRAKAAKQGLSEYAVGKQVADAMNPSAVGTVVINETSLSIYIKNKNAPESAADIKQFKITKPNGKEIRVKSVATVKVVDDPASITTIRGARSATITITPNSDDVGTASASVAQALAKVELPASANATLGGVTSQQGDAFYQLSIALLVAILIVYVVMVATFKSLRQPLLLLVSVPFAATGAIALQVISGIPLGTASFIGLLMLVGIVVTNAIVLIDLVNQYREKGMAVREAVIEGTSRRLRPILMTALATIFALVPLGIGLTGHGGFISQPLAIIVIGGLVSSTLLTLIVLPSLYYLVEGFKERKPERIARRAARSAWWDKRFPSRVVRREKRAAKRALRDEKKAARTAAKAEKKATRAAVRAEKKAARAAAKAEKKAQRA